MSEISIVTAFFPIGRGTWTPDKGYPHYLERSDDVYIERFSHLAKLDNDIVVFTVPEMNDKIDAACAGRDNKVTVVNVRLDEVDSFIEMRNAIANVQESEDFRKQINPSQIKNPEYWNADYVQVTNLKAHFVHHAVREKLVKNEMVAWIDFGYCRSEKNIPETQIWDYDFDPKKIHLFSYKPYPPNKPFIEVIANNDVFILGAKAVAHQDKWGLMERLMWTAHDELMKNNLVDDDQGLWLLASLMEPEAFELHSIPDHQQGHDPFVLFNQFNNKIEE